MTVPAEVALAPEVVLLLVAGVGGILIWRYMTREQARSLQDPTATPLPPPLPTNPGLVPPPGLPDTPADVGFPQAPTTPDLPPQLQTAPLPHLLATPASDQGGPTIFHQDRNKGLEGGARTNSSRARKGARAADPEVTQTLQDEEWRAHHLFAVAVAKRFPELVAAAARAGWRMDEVSNMAALPASREAQKKLAEAGMNRPVHDNAHPGWNNAVETAARKIMDGLKSSAFPKDMLEYDQAARKALEDAEKIFRQEVIKLTRVTQNDQAAPKAFT